MRVLTATSATQGDRPDDICCATEGELVSFPLLECSCPDCGCVRSFAGLDSQRATTTCTVVDRPLDLADLRRAVTGSLAAGGWLLDLVEGPADLHERAGGTAPGVALSAVDRELVDDVVARILEVASSFPAGTVLARADGGVVVRRVSA